MNILPAHRVIYRYLEDAKVASAAHAHKNASLSEELRAGKRYFTITPNLNTYIWPNNRSALSLIELPSDDIEYAGTRLGLNLSSYRV